MYTRIMNKLTSQSVHSTDSLVISKLPPHQSSCVCVRACVRACVRVCGNLFLLPLSVWLPNCKSKYLMFRAIMGVFITAFRLLLIFYNSTTRLRHSHQYTEVTNHSSKPQAELDNWVLTAFRTDETQVPLSMVGDTMEYPGLFNEGFERPRY